MTANVYLIDDRYHGLVEALMQGFIRAATSHLTDMRDETVNALAEAGVMPASTCGDFACDCFEHTVAHMQA